MSSACTTYWMQQIKYNLGRLTPGVRKSLWSSNLDGGSMREIGFVTLSDHSDFEFKDCWLPDGQRISFVYHDTLYVVPVR